MLKEIKKSAELFLKKSEGRNITIISHHDTDGITSAAIMAKTLQRLDKKFSIKIIKQLEEEMIDSFPKNLLIFLDLGSSSLNHISKLKSDIFIIDHHEISGKPAKNINIINPHLFNEEDISGASLTYLFSKELNKENTNLANLAVIGMVGDMLGQNLSKLNNQILNDAEVMIKKGLLLYPSTRPLHKALEFSSIFIPGVTGSPKGSISLLKEAGIERINGQYKSLIELDDDEMSNLITAVILRRMKKNKHSDIIGNIYLVKFLNRLEDAREISAIINACSRLDSSETAFSLCMGNKKARKKAEKIYASYKQHIISALNYISNSKKLEGKEYIIINAKNKIKDTIIGTIASMLSSSPIYEEGTAIIAMAYSQEKIKVSARVAGRNGKNVYKILSSVTQKIGGECGGHSLAAGCLISREKETEFIEELKKRLEVEIVKI